MVIFKYIVCQKCNHYIIIIIGYQMSIYQASVKNEKVENTKFKVLIIGTSGVGKTSLLIKYVKNTFCYDYQVTLGAEYYTKIVKINEKHHANLQIWDTMGQEAFRAVVRSLYKGVSAILLVYSIDRLQSFQQLPDWYKQIHETSHKDTVIFLVGTKLDLEELRQVSKHDAQQYAKTIKADGFVQVSAKTGQNVKQLFDKLAKIVVKKFNNCQSFRQLVQPTFDQAFSKSRSLSLIDYRLTLRESKNCC